MTAKDFTPRFTLHDRKTLRAVNVRSIEAQATKTGELGRVCPEGLHALAVAPDPDIQNWARSTILQPLAIQIFTEGLVAGGLNHKITMEQGGYVLHALWDEVREGWSDVQDVSK